MAVLRMVVADSAVLQLRSVEEHHLITLIGQAVGHRQVQRALNSQLVVTARLPLLPLLLLLPSQGLLELPPDIGIAARQAAVGQEKRPPMLLLRPVQQMELLGMLTLMLPVAVEMDLPTCATAINQ